MNIAAPWIRRPVATTLIAIGILLVGIVAYMRLPIAALPSVDRPTIALWAGLPGASADTIASALAQPLERQIGSIPGIVEMRSFSATGGTQLTVQFQLDKNIDAAAGAIQAAINAAGPNLPKDMPQPPGYWKVNPSGWSVITLALTSEVLDPSDVYDFADTVVAEQISQVPGVAQVMVSGAEHGAVHIRVDPGRIAAMHVSLEQIRAAVRNATLNLPKGRVNLDGRFWSIVANDQLYKAPEYRDIVVAWRNGAPVMLRDVAEVTDGVINARLAGWYNNEPGVVIRVFKQPNANIVATVDAVKALLPQLEHWMPPAIKVHVIFDRTTLIRAAIVHVQLTIVVAIALVVLIVALFLRQVSATVIPALAIPVALAATLVVMERLGYSLDNLTLMALTVAIGFVVDDAVIMIENIMRHMEAGMRPLRAAFAGARQIGFTVLSISAALMAALVPVLFMPDVVGRYFREFGITLAAAIVASALVSLTLTPMLCSRFLGRIERRDRREFAVVARISAQSRLGAAPSCAHRGGGDDGDRRQRLPLSRHAQGVHADAGHRRDIRAHRDDRQCLVHRDDRAAACRVDRGSRRPGGRRAEFLHRHGQRLCTQQRRAAGRIEAASRPPDDRSAGDRPAARQPGQGTGRADILHADPGPGTRRAKAAPRAISTRLRQSDPDHLAQWADRMRRAMADLKGTLTDVINSNEIAGLQAGLEIDRVRAAAMGVTPLAVDNTLYDAFGQRQIRTIYLPHNYSRVILEAGPAMQADPASLNTVFVPGTGGGQVPLAALTRLGRSHGTMWMVYSGQFPAATISFDTLPGVSIGDAIAAIRGLERTLHLPDDIRAEFRGEAGEATKAGTQQLLLFLAAIFAVYVVLGVLYESYAHPFTILTTLPPAIFGALLALRIVDIEFTLITTIGCILLVGMVMKNAIMLVDFALQAERQDGLAPVDAIMLAARRRARPIVMTTLVAVLSAVPLAVGTGPGFELRQPLGVSIVGGLLASQLLTLYTTPVIYLLVGRLRRRPTPHRAEMAVR